MGQHVMKMKLLYFSLTIFISLLGCNSKTKYILNSAPDSNKTAYLLFYTSELSPDQEAISFSLEELLPGKSIFHPDNNIFTCESENYFIVRFEKFTESGKTFNELEKKSEDIINDFHNKNKDLPVLFKLKIIEGSKAQ